MMETLYHPSMISCATSFLAVATTSTAFINLPILSATMVTSFFTVEARSVSRSFDLHSASLDFLT
jgi:hypothetical protein